MAISLTLSRYIGRMFLLRFAIVTGGLIFLLLMGDFVETLRQYAAREVIGVPMALGLSLLKMPNLAEQAFPIAVLIAAMWTFTTLNRQKELVVTRASGVSAWQFLMPAVLIALFAGLFVVFLYNPIASMMFNRYASLEAQHLRGQTSQISVSSEGLWLMQSHEGDRAIIHALRINDGDPTSLSLEDVTFFRFSGRDDFAGHIHAESARLGDGEWLLTSAWTTPATGEPTFAETITTPTSLTRDQIRESFASPETLSVYDLPAFIAQAEEAGLSAARHKVHWYSILATPLLFLAMVLIAASFSLRTARLTGFVGLTAAAAGTGFLLFFIADVTAAMGQSGSMPAPLAAWAPTMVALLFGTTVLLHLEDG